MPYSVEEVNSTLEEARSVSKDLKVELSKLRVKLDRVEHAQVILAIREVFGTEYISDYGNIYITYDMYVTCIDLIRNVGKAIGDSRV